MNALRPFALFGLVLAAFVSPALANECDLGDYQPSHYDFDMGADRYGQNDVPTAYYKLAISWSPAFCQRSRERLRKLQRQGKGDQASLLSQKIGLQCLSGNEYGWVIHGLWGQAADARKVADHPRFCKGDLPQVPFNRIKPYLCNSPSAHLLQGEWEKHGSCDFDKPSAYFEQQQRLFQALTLPDGYRTLSQAIRWIKNRNPHLKDKWLGKGRDEIFICYDKAFQVMDCRK